MKRKYLVWILLSLLLGGCSFFAQKFTPGKTLNEDESDLSKYANRIFWQNFHQGNYDSLDQVINLLNAAYLQNPGNLKIIDHLGFAHIWKFSESQRLEKTPPDILEDFILSRKFFEESHGLNADDPRILGFLGDTKMVEGNISGNQKLIVEGYFDGKESIHQWPEFNKFTLGYPLSQRDTGSSQFKEALEWQWESLDDCSCKKWDRNNLNYADLTRMIRESQDPKIQRACWNTWIAPHNYEGFFMNMGDMLVKSGNWKKGIELYNAAKLSPNYSDWPYAQVLEERIQNAQKNRVEFNKPIVRSNPAFHNQTVMMVASKIDCMGCHQMGKEEYTRKGYLEPSKNIYYFSQLGH